MDPGQSSDGHANAGEGETVEIKIKTLDAQTYTLRVDKNTPVPALKDQIASVVGVPVENQRLICRGKVLKDDQLLATYNVEDGHTLHLVARPLLQPSRLSLPSGQEQASGPSGPSDMVIVSPRNRAGNHVSHSVLMGTINIPDTGEGGMPDLNRVISAVLSSVGIGNAIPGGTGAGPGGSVAVGVLPPRTQQTTGLDGQPRAGGADTRLPGGPPLGEQNESIDDIEAQLQLDAIYGVPSPGIFAGTGTAVPSNPFRIVHQPAVVPDALTTMSQYLDRLEQSFSIIGGRGHTGEGLPASEAAIHPEANTGLGQTSVSLLGQGVGIIDTSSAGPSNPSSHTAANSGRQGTGVPAGPVASSRRLPTPSSLGIIVNRVQQLLSGQAGTALSRLAAQLENEPNLVDAVAREQMQRTALRDGNMMQQLGALLLELGRATLTLRLGETPAESVVNAGPAVFISPSGPNPMMVQPPPRAVIGVTSGAPALTVRQMMERADAANPEHGLTVRQIIERAEAANGVQQGNAESNSNVASGGAVQGAFMTFSENGAMRVVPVRTHRTGAVPIATHPHVVNEGDAIFQPLLARFQQHMGSGQHSRLASTPPGSSVATATHSAGTTSPRENPSAARPPPSVRAQVHIQAWAPSVIQALGEGTSPPESSQPVSGAAPVDEVHVPPVTGQVQAGAHDSHTDSTIPLSNNRVADGQASGQRAEGLVQGVDVAHIVDSLGPFLNQLAVAFQQARPNPPHPPDQPPSQPPSQQLNEQPIGLQPNVDVDTLNGPVPAASLGDAQESNELSMKNGGASSADPAEQGAPGVEIKSDDQMDVADGDENALHIHDGPGSSSTSTLPVVEKPLSEKCSSEGGLVDGHVEEADQPVAPIGLGLGGLQPLPAKSRRRSHLQPRQTQTPDMGAAAAAGNGLPAPIGREQTLTPAGQNLLQSLVARRDRPSNRPEDAAMEQSSGDLMQGLLPLLGGIASRGTVQGGAGNRELGDIMGQLTTRSAEGSASQGPFPADMLRGMMGQLVQSPLMENLVQQVMTGAQNAESQDGEHPFAGLGNCSQGASGGFDFAGIVQQMLPVVSQMFGSRSTPSAGQQVPTSANVRNLNGEGAARDGSDQINDSGTWREALSEEEATLWSETIAADVEQQQSMEPQRPFSDVYVRGSPLAKRQKTELEGTAPQKLENGGPPEDLSVPEIAPPAYIGGSNGSTHGQRVPHLAQQASSGERIADTPILAMIPGSQIQPESSNSRRRPRSQLEGDDDRLRLS